MRFRFCGELESPDWLLAEVETLSKQSSVRVRVLVTALLERLCGGEMDYAKASRLFSDAADAAASIAALDFLLCGAASHSCDEQLFARELLQLGLPAEHADAVSKPYGARREALRAALLSEPAARLQRWRVLSPLAGGAPKLELSLEVGGRREEVSLGDLDQARLLLHELRQAQAAMAALSSQPESAADEAAIEREGGEREGLEES